MMVAEEEEEVKKQSRPLWRWYMSLCRHNTTLRHTKASCRSRPLQGALGSWSRDRLGLMLVRSSQRRKGEKSWPSAM